MFTVVDTGLIFGCREAPACDDVVDVIVVVGDVDRDLFALMWIDACGCCCWDAFDRWGFVALFDRGLTELDRDRVRVTRFRVFEFRVELGKKRCVCVCACVSNICCYLYTYNIYLLDYCWTYYHSWSPLD